jgi:hypothetical protein
MPPCLSYTLDAQSAALSSKQKWCYFVQHKAFTASGFFGAAFSAGIAQLTHSPEDWGQGAAGYGKRFGTRYTQNLLKNTVETAIGVMNHEEPRPSRPSLSVRALPPIPGEHWRRRLGNALLGTIWVHRDDTRSDFIALSRIGGAFASGFIGMSWTPEPDNSIAAAFGRTGTALAGYAGSNVLHEFQPDIISALSKMFGTGKPKP